MPACPLSATRDPPQRSRRHTPTGQLRPTGPTHATEANGARTRGPRAAERPSHGEPNGRTPARPATTATAATPRRRGPGPATTERPTRPHDTAPRPARPGPREDESCDRDEVPTPRPRRGWRGTADPTALRRAPELVTTPAPPGGAPGGRTPPRVLGTPPGRGTTPALPKAERRAVGRHPGFLGPRPAEVQRPPLPGAERRAVGRHPGFSGPRPAERTAPALARGGASGGRTPPRVLGSPPSRGYGARPCQGRSVGRKDATQGSRVPAQPI